MIMIPMDEAGAFDMLAILGIKRDAGLIDDYQIETLCRLMKLQMTEDAYLSAYLSPEFAALEEANLAMWQIQEAAMRDACKASDVDRQNQARYHAKQALQKKFFGGELTEQKSVRPYEQEAAK